ncbi:tripartite tricarboxylate transporter permease [Candidatus Micrarchaeota archaeon]|nr:tripartite tricarboxylate transporter permease [Candidatus Micrarchaeota archaeon]
MDLYFLLVLIFGGLFVGFLIGLLPALHYSLLIGLLPLLGLSGFESAIVLLSIFPSYLVSSSIFSIFFSVPKGENPTSLLPGQRLILSGEGGLLVRTIVISFIAATLFSLLLFPLSSLFYSTTYSLVRPYLGYSLILASIFLIARSKNLLLGLLLFLSAGIFGKFVFTLGLSDPFLPLFTGLFAVPALLLSGDVNLATSAESGSLASQSSSSSSSFVALEKSDLKSLLSYSLLGTLLCMISNLFPAIGSSGQIAAFGSLLVPFSSVNYLATVSAITVSQVIFSFSSSLSIDKSRIGAIESLSKFSSISDNLYLFIGLFVFGLFLSCILSLFLSRRLSGFGTLEFSKLSKFILLYLLILVFYLSGFWGLLVLVVGSLIGYLAIKFEIERILLMGCLIVPTILLLL